MKVLVFLAAIAAVVVADEIDDEVAKLTPAQIAKLAKLYQATCKPAGTYTEEPTYPKKPEQKEIDWEAEREKVIKQNAEKYAMINNGKNADVLTLDQLQKKFVDAGFGNSEVKKLADDNGEKVAKKTKETVEK